MPESALASDTARVRFAGGEIESASVTGAPATFEQKRRDEMAQGRAKRIDYDLKRGAVELAGEAWLSDGKTEITGETLVYSTTSQRVVSQQEVRITIQPGEPAPEQPKPDP
jgi:lipopolysaccharide transport protein LptA